MLISILGSAAVLGAAGAAHCAAMCGPIAAAACAGAQARKEAAEYLAARLAGYALVGALLGVAGPLLAGWIGGSLLVRLQLVLLGGVAAALIARGLRALWPGRALGAVAGGPLVQLRLRVAPAPSRLGRALALLPRRGAFLGAITAVLPCGQLLAAWALAASTGRPDAGAAAMAVFALASTPGLLAPLAAALSLRGSRRVWLGSPRLAGLMWLLLGAALVARLLLSAAAPEGTCHG